MIEIEKLSFKYDESEAESILKEISFTIEAGEWLTIVGENASGKSTLARNLNGLLFPSRGSVRVDGVLTTDEKKIADIRHRVGYIFQNPDNQIVATTVEEDVAFGPENAGVPSKEIRERVDEALSLVGMEAFAKQAPHLLSGGQKQKIAIAGVLAMRPQYLVIDEATSMLDPVSRKEINSILKRFNQQRGMTIIAITHHMEEVLLADRVLAMKRGQIKRILSPQELFQNEQLVTELGLELPDVAELSKRLFENRMLSKRDIYVVEEMVESLCQLK